MVSVYDYEEYVPYLIERVAQELLPEQRTYSTDDTVGVVVRQLVDKIMPEAPEEKKRKSDVWRPEFIVGWVDEGGVWKGSTEVAKRLAVQFGGIPTYIVKVKDLLRLTRRDPGYEVDEGTLAMITIPDGRKRGLLVDDAMITGGRLKWLFDALKDKFPDLDLRTAVLSAKRGGNYQVDLDYAGAEHDGDDVLFPWGWARTVPKLRHIYETIGTRDRRFMPRLVSDPRAQVISIARNEDGANLFETRSTGPDALPTFELGDLHDDHLLYVSNGSVTITVGGISGVFRRSEFLYIPYVVPYKISFDSEETVLLTLAFDPSTEELAKRLGPPVEWDQRQPGDTWRTF